MCDQPEERAVLYLKSSGSLFPCTSCTVGRDSSCTEAGTNVPTRDVRETVRAQLRNVMMGDFRGSGAMRTEAEIALILTSMVPDRSAWAGLGNGPRMWYRLPGFDRLHVRFSQSTRFHSLPSCFLDVQYYGCVLCQAACVGGRCHLTKDLLRVHSGALMYCDVVFCWSGHGRRCQPQGFKRCTRVPAEDRSPGWPCTAWNCHQYRARHQYEVQTCLTSCTRSTHTPRARYTVENEGVVVQVTRS